MNEDLLYTLDPYIISILFKSKDDKKTLDIYTDMVEAVGFVFDETIKEYLLENKFSEEDVQKVLDTEDLENVETRFKPYLQNIILFNRIQANSKQLIKLYYDQLLPNLTQQEKDDLSAYLKENEELIKVRKEGIMEGLKELKAILDENGVKSYQELVEKSEKTNSESIKAPETLAADGMQSPQWLTAIPEATPTIKEEPIITPEPPTANTINIPTPNPMDSINPVKATIIEDEPIESTLPAGDQLVQPQANPVVEQSPSPVDSSSKPNQMMEENPQGPNLISQLADMGINLDDNSTVAPTGTPSADNIPTPQ